MIDNIDSGIESNEELSEGDALEEISEMITNEEQLPEELNDRLRELTEKHLESNGEVASDIKNIRSEINRLEEEIRS